MDIKDNEKKSEERTTQLVTFRLGANEYGIDIMQAREIIKMEKITLIPNAPHYVEGVINLRGNVIPIIDLKRRFNLEEIDGEKNSGIIIVSVSGVDMGIMIDSVSKVVLMPDESIQDPPHMFAGIGQKYIKGVGKIDANLLVILDLAQLLTDNEDD